MTCRVTRVNMKHDFASIPIPTSNYSRWVWGSGPTNCDKLARLRFEKQEPVPSVGLRVSGSGQLSLHDHMGRQGATWQSLDAISQGKGDFCTLQVNGVGLLRYRTRLPSLDLRYDSFAFLTSC